MHNTINKKIIDFFITLKQSIFALEFGLSYTFYYKTIRGT